MQTAAADAARADVVPGVTTDAAVVFPDDVTLSDAQYDPASQTYPYVDVLAVWSPAAQARDSNIRNTIIDRIKRANTANATSGVYFRFRLIHAAAFSYTETTSNMATDLDRVQDTANSAFAGVRSLRTQYRADLVVLVGAYTDPKACGIASYMNNSLWGPAMKPYAMSVADVTRGATCSTLTMAHEMGHNMGLAHDWDNDATPTSSHFSPAYNHGYTSSAGGFATVMSYGTKKNPVSGKAETSCPAQGQCVRIARWSNPNLTYTVNGVAYPTGVPESLPQPANNAHALNVSAPVAALWEVGNDPFGVVSSVVRAPGGVRARGWALDRNMAPSSALGVTVQVDGASAGSGTANISNSEVDGAYPGFGPNHGYSVKGAAAGGSHTVCVIGTNVGAGVNASLGCLSFFADPNPVGSFSSIVRAPGGARISGWALDPDTSGSISVSVTVDGASAGTFTANRTTSSIPSTYDEWGDAHGFSGLVSMSSGVSHNVCVTALNTSTGANKSLGCKSFTPGTAPIGAFDSIYMYPDPNTYTAMKVVGWAIDPDTTAATSVEIRVDGASWGTVTANVARSDVAASYPDYGANHGFSTEIWLWNQPANTTHSFCVYGNNVAGSGSKTLLGCKNFYVNTNVVGSFTLARVSTGLGTSVVRATGWTLDPGTSASLTGQAYDQASQAATKKTFTANGYGTDWLGSYPYHGSYHRFTVDITEPPPVPGVTHTICIDAYGWYTQSLGCRSIE